MSENKQLAVVEQPQELITIEPTKYVELVFEPFAKRLADAKTLADAATFDVTTTAGMAVAVKHRATFREIRVESEKARKIRKAPILEIGKLLDSRQKEIEAEIEPFESRFDDAIKAEEARKDAEKAAKAAAEKARVDGIRKRIAEMQAIPAMLVGKQSATIATAIEGLEAVEITLESFMECAGEAELAKIATVAKLGEMLTAQVAHEKEQERLAEERAEFARQQAEMAEKQRKLREETERLAREHREREEAEARRLKAERDAHEAELRRQREAEEAKLRAEREAAQRQLDEQRAEIARQQAEIAAAKAEQERIERERQAAIEAEARAKREAEEAAARAEAARLRAEQDAAIAEQKRRERVEFEKNGPGDVEIVLTLAATYQVSVGDAMQWMKKFDYEAADEQFAAMNACGSLPQMEKAA